MAILRVKRNTAYRRDFKDVIYYYIAHIDDRLIYGAAKTAKTDDDSTIMDWIGSIYDIDYFTGHVANQMTKTTLSPNSLSKAQRATIKEVLQ